MLSSIVPQEGEFLHNGEAPPPSVAALGKCPDDLLLTDLAAWEDGSGPDVTPSPELLEHVDSCPDCGERLATLRAEPDPSPWEPPNPPAPATLCQALRPSLRSLVFWKRRFPEWEPPAYLVEHFRSCEECYLLLWDLWREQEAPAPVAGGEPSSPSAAPLAECPPEALLADFAAWLEGEEVLFTAPLGFQAHLDTCPDCRETVATARAAPRSPTTAPETCGKPSPPSPAPAAPGGPQHTSRPSPPTPRRAQRPSVADSAGSDDLERAKALPLDQVAEALGLTLTPDRKRARCFRPEHHSNGDRNPSLSLDLEHGRWKCWVSGEGGDAVDLVRAVAGIGFKEALEYLLRLAGGGPTPTFSRRPTGAHRSARARPEPPPAAVVEVWEALLALGEPAPAVEYLARRAISPEVVERCGIVTLPRPGAAFAFLVERFGIERVTAAGLVPSSGGFLFARHPLLFPFRRRGRVVSLQARSLDPNCPKKLRYLCLKRTGALEPIPCLWNVDCLEDLEPGARVYLAEGFTDALSLLTLGESAVVGVVGVGGFKAEWADDLAPFQVVVCPDRDKAGGTLVAAVARLLPGQVEELTLPDGAGDMNEYLLNLSKED